ncbi:hypothetical protein GCM10029992_36350 [Glycomyces albus]
MNGFEHLTARASFDTALPFIVPISSVSVGEDDKQEAYPERRCEAASDPAAAAATVRPDNAAAATLSTVIVASVPLPSMTAIRTPRSRRRGGALRGLPWCRAAAARLAWKSPVWAMGTWRAG